MWRHLPLEVPSGPVSATFPVAEAGVCPAICGHKAFSVLSQSSLGVYRFLSFTDIIEYV